MNIAKRAVGAVLLAILLCLTSSVFATAAPNPPSGPSGTIQYPGSPGSSGTTGTPGSPGSGTSSCGTCTGLPSAPIGAQFCVGSTPDYWYWWTGPHVLAWVHHVCTSCPQPVAGVTPFSGSCAGVPATPGTPGTPGAPPMKASISTFPCPQTSPCAVTFSASGWNPNVGTWLVYQPITATIPGALPAATKPLPAAGGSTGGKMVITFTPLDKTTFNWDDGVVNHRTTFSANHSYTHVSGSSGIPAAGATVTATSSYSWTCQGLINMPGYTIPASPGPPPTAATTVPPYVVTVPCGSGTYTAYYRSTPPHTIDQLESVGIGS